MMSSIQKVSWCFLALVLVFSSCQRDDEPIDIPSTPTDVPIPPNTPPNVQEEMQDGRLRPLPLNIPTPNANPNTPEKIALGRALFWDPILSGERDVSCATCHHPAAGYSDGLDLPIGVGGVGFGDNREVGYTGFVQRNTPTIINTAYNGINQNGNVNPDNAEMFWDNRAHGLEEQALMPLHSFAEMRGNAFEEDETLEVIVERLNAIDDYRDRFQAAFGDNNVNSENIARALAAFQRTIIANNSPFDEYMRGDETAMTQQQIRGMNVFVNVGCINCHNGPMFSDYELHVLGVRENNKLDEADEGDGNFAFRTPTLRNLRFTGPYMHNGEFNTLRRVLDFYDDNNNNSQNPNVNDNELDRDLRRLDNLNQGAINDILAFLEALNDENFDRSIPKNVPSGLNPGGNID